ncbi:MAG: hypothetical protein A4E65_02059 [Syntrophorhabdus sp. PtaU1.Bin153]|nr:MAG: hypothetical protein A4E65_02059 [Syntrophorhabdus sp. PtaU1.Bin153]
MGIDDAKGLQAAPMSLSRGLHLTIIDLLSYLERERAEYGDEFAQSDISLDDVDVDSLCDMAETLVEKVNAILTFHQNESGEDNENERSQEIALTADNRLCNVWSVKDTILSVIGAQEDGAENLAGLPEIGLALGRDGFLEFNESTFKEALRGRKETTVNTVATLGDSLYERLHWYVDPNAALFADLTRGIHRPRDGDESYIAEADAQLTKKKEELEKKLQTVNTLISTSTDLIDRLSGRAPRADVE